jgi:hypothetical protein
MATSMADLGFNIDSSPMRRASRELDRMSTASGRAERSADGLAGAYRAVGAAVAALGLAQLTRSVFDTVRSTEALQASLKTVTGSISEANAAWDTLEQFAKTTPFTLDQSVKGFIRMKSLGLDPTTDALESFGNTASAMGKDLMQMIEAVADASTGEFERLKEFGIRARTEGDNIRFIFQGMETVVDNSSTAITGYLESLGNTAFAGAMADQMDTVGGQVSNLEDQIDSLFRAIGDAGATDLFKESIAGASDAVETLTNNLDQVAAAAAGVTAATGAYLLFSNATAAATAAQVAFNAAARVNPYIFIASTIAGATAAVWAFTNAQSSATEVWERATESEAAYQAALADVGAANRIQQIAKERAELQERLVDAQSRWIRNGTEEEHIKQRLAELEAEYHQITDARIEAEKAANERREEARAREEEALKRQAEIERQQEAAKAAAAKAERDAAIDQIDLLRERLGLLKEGTVEFRRNMETVREAVALGIITKDQAAQIVQALPDAAEESCEEFVNQWQSAADRVAQSLQDAIASGDWDKIGDAIGNSLATSIAGIVNKTITDSLAKDLTANSSVLAQIGGAFAGPIAGAVAGGAIQLAVSELSDFFSGSDWDPTEARQAAQGTGTVLGSIDAKSESIAKAVDISAGASRELVGINRDMLRALQTLQLGIAGASGMVARSYGGINFTAQDLFSQTDMAGAGMLLGVSAFGLGSLGAAGLIGNALGPIGGLLTTGLLDGAIDFIDNLAGGLFSDIGGTIFGGKTDVKDVGIQFFGATLDEMIRGWRDGDRYLTAQAYATIKRDGGWFGSDDRWDEFQRLGPEAENQISLVFMGIRDSVTAGAEALGMSGAEIQSALDTFRVETQKISLEGLSAEEQTAELEAVFSSIFDQAAGAVVPYLDDFQRAGEGLGETLARVATQVQVTEQAVDMLGLRFSDLAGAELIEASQRLVELNGGLDQFISNMQNFIGNFATEAQQFEINANALAQGMGDLPLPETRDGFWALMQAQDAATEEGAENIATLLRLQGVADQYYSAIEKAQTSYYETEVQGQRERLQEAQRANRAVQSAMDAMLYQSTAVQEASRQSALRTLEQIANAGRVSDIGQLQSALDAATQLDQGRYSTFADYAREYARTSGVIGRVGDVTQQAEDREARMLRSLENQLEAVKGLRDDLERSQLAIIKQTNKTAKTLERFEIDGIEVRQ